MLWTPSVRVDLLTVTPPLLILTHMVDLARFHSQVNLTLCGLDLRAFLILFEKVARQPLPIDQGLKGSKSYLPPIKG
jgi:hypothetical protein